MENSIPDKTSLSVDNEKEAEKEVFVNDLSDDTREALEVDKPGAVEPPGGIGHGDVAPAG